MTTVGIVTGAGRGMGLACAAARRPGGQAAPRRPGRGDGDRGRQGPVRHRAGALVEPFVLDITDAAGLAGLAVRVGELGTLRAVAHAAGISPTMADWRRIFTVDLVGTALLAQTLRPLATEGTALVCFASMAPLLGGTDPDPAVDAVLDDPLDERFLDRVHEAVGPGIEDTGIAYAWAKRGVHRFVQREAVRIGPLGARVCSVSPG
ncbi:SDR family oxidoreductase [Streptomyces mirabilis]|nr:SDR family oxidoreductase [Streptomyces mirabilis]